MSVPAITSPEEESDSEKEREKLGKIKCCECGEKKAEKSDPVDAYRAFASETSAHGFRWTIGTGLRPWVAALWTALVCAAIATAGYSVGQGTVVTLSLILQKRAIRP